MSDPDWIDRVSAVLADQAAGRVGPPISQLDEYVARVANHAVDIIFERGVDHGRTKSEIAGSVLVMATYLDWAATRYADEVGPSLGMVE